jgi:septal ring factor EnvC (AmiA/AmiB activator)
VVGQETVTETFLDRDALRKNIQDKMTSLEKERTAKKGSFKKVSKQQKNLKELEKQFDDTSKSTEQLAEEYKKLGGEISANNGILKNSSKQINKYKMTIDSLARGISSVGSAALGAGSALLLLGSALSAMGEEEAAEAVTTIGSYVTAIGSLAMMAPEALKGIRGMANAFDISAGAMVGWIAVAALAVAAIIKFTEAAKEFGKARKLSTQIDEVNDKIADLGEAADEAKKKIESIASERENFNKLKKQFEGLTKGTKEWR